MPRATAGAKKKNEQIMVSGAILQHHVQRSREQNLIARPWTVPMSTRKSAHIDQIPSHWMSVSQYASDEPFFFSRFTRDVH
jgi:hypothetical protein